MTFKENLIIKDIFKNIDPNLLAKWKTYHQKNPHVYKKFRELAFAMHKTGRTKYSAWTIINKLRWDHDISTTGDVFKISNDYIALYARLLIYHHNELLDFFDLKPMKGDLRHYSSEEKERVNAI